MARPPRFPSLQALPSQLRAMPDCTSPELHPVVGQNIGRHAGRRSPVKRACVTMSLVLALLGTLRAALKARTDLVPENLALRQAARPAPPPLQATSGRPPRPRLLDVALAVVGTVARSAPCRSAADRDSLAPAGLPRVLELEVAARSNRSSARRFGARQARPHHGPCQSPLGRAAHSWRAPQAWSRRVSAHGWSAHASLCETALTDLADLPRKSRRRSCLGRLLRRAHGDVPRALRVRSPPPSPPPSRTFQRDRLPYRGLDGAAGCRGLPPRLGAPVAHPRSRRHFRRTVSTTGEGHRSCRGPHRAALPVAEPFRGARDRNHQA